MNEDAAPMRGIVIALLLSGPAWVALCGLGWPALLLIGGTS